MTMPFMESIRTAIDFVGLNYYGQEFMAGIGKIAILDEEEYSDSGRAVYPDGLYHLLKAFNRRFPTLPIIITENGVADDADVIRPAYITEHLLAVAAARAENVPVAGYVFWTISDNWEWADGYCPKFGLAAVDRSKASLPRVLRHTSYDLFKELATTKQLTQRQADAAWRTFSEAVLAKRNRSFCRALEGTTGMTGFSGLDSPISRPLVAKDWRLGKWQPPMYVDALSRALRSARDAALGAVAGVAGVEVETLWARWVEMNARAKQQASARAAEKAAKARAAAFFPPAAAPAAKKSAAPADAQEEAHEEL